MVGCVKCDNTGWVCENHGELPWDGISVRFDACHCGGAGAPCKCNPCDRSHPPEFGPQVTEIPFSTN